MHSRSQESSQAAALEGVGEERAEHDVAIGATERVFRSFFEHAEIGMARSRFADARCLDVNDAFARMVGYSREQLRSIAWTDITHPDDLELDFRQYQRMARGEIESYAIEKRFIHADGRHVWVRVTPSLVRDEHGRPDFDVAFVEDITERKRAEDALRRANERLRDEGQRKNDFLAVLSHELRNPLAPIRYGVDILEHAPPGSEQATRALQVLRRQAQHMTRLIDDLLDVTRASRGKLTLKREVVQLVDLVRATAEDYREVFRKAGVELRVEAGTRALCLSGDRLRLAQVIGNLLQNAAKFTPRGGRVVLRVDEGSPGEGVVRVTDTGAGMSQAVLERLFEPFAQAVETVERSRGGLGIGLALVRGLVELHGGSVEARSDGEGRGSELTVRLPLDRPCASEAEPPPSRRTDLPGRRVLVIEDNVDAAESLRALLELGEHEVTIACTGDEGLAAARALRPDIVICDIGLPGLDGYAVARALRATSELRSTFLIALSGYALAEDIAEAEAAGFDRHLAKPPSLDALERLLADAPVGRGDHGS